MQFNHVKVDLPTIHREEGDFARRYITPTGERYPSVTTVLSSYGKEKLDAWRERVGQEKANKVSRTATVRGAGVHKLIEKLLLNEELDLREHVQMPNVKAMYFKMREELIRRVNNVHCIEKGLFSHKMRLAGTVDCIAEYDGVLSVIDFKTSVRLKKKEDIANYFMQCVAYADMYTEQTGIVVPQVVVMIGVDVASFVQTMKAAGHEKIDPYRQELYKYIHAYNSGNDML